MTEPAYPINVVATRTGLSVHVIRVWERRYGAVKPQRTESGRRLYSESEIERLNLLRQQAAAGQSIAYLAQLTTDELRQLPVAAKPAVAAATPEQDDSRRVGACVDAVGAMNATALTRELERAHSDLGLQGALQRVIAPLAREIGDGWRAGRLTAAHEHFASNLVRTLVTRWAQSFTGAAVGPTLVVATPQGQLHELGAVLAAAAAGNLGWRVVYLGASLPLTEIAAAARQQQARAVALSLVYPPDDTALATELPKLRPLLDPTCALVAGGGAAPAYAGALSEAGATIVDDLTQFGAWLDAIRVPARR